jgi:demethylmenaquinone methyltransferase/2-methoxy-6-polyprenyl-1,4-benzoquinol methylase
MYVERYYNSIAPFNDLLTRVGSLGAFPGLHRAAADALELSPGDVALDLCCGSGLMIPYLREKITDAGRVIAVDRSDKMLEVVRRKIERAGWRNVEPVQHDVSTFEPPALVDGVVFSISLSAVPECEKVLKVASTFLKPGKRMVVVDAFLNEGRWYYPFTNAYTALKARVVGSNLDNRIRETAAATLEDVRVVNLHAGLYSMISGSRPA